MPSEPSQNWLQGVTYRNDAETGVKVRVGMLPQKGDSSRFGERRGLFLDGLHFPVVTSMVWTIVGTAVTVLGFLYGLYQDYRRRSEREWIHMALVNLKPSIQGPNQGAVIVAINNMLEFLKPPRAKTSK
jgi:hypothetical protein